MPNEEARNLAEKLSFNLGNALMNIAESVTKKTPDKVDSLERAITYLNREINRLCSEARSKKKYTVDTVGLVSKVSEDDQGIVVDLNESNETKPTTQKFDLTTGITDEELEWLNKLPNTTCVRNGHRLSSVFGNEYWRCVHCWMVFGDLIDADSYRCLIRGPYIQEDRTPVKKHYLVAAPDLQRTDPRSRRLMCKDCRQYFSTIGESAYFPCNAIVTVNKHTFKLITKGSDNVWTCTRCGTVFDDKTQIPKEGLVVSICGEHPRKWGWHNDLLGLI